MLEHGEYLLTSLTMVKTAATRTHVFTSSRYSAMLKFNITRIIQLLSYKPKIIHLALAPGTMSAQRSVTAKVGCPHILVLGETA